VLLLPLLGAGPTPLRFPPYLPLLQVKSDVSDPAETGEKKERKEGRRAKKERKEKEEGADSDAAVAGRAPSWPALCAYAPVCAPARPVRTRTAGAPVVR